MSQSASDVIDAAASDGPIDDDIQYKKSYILIGALVGVVGAMLPLAFIAGEGFLFGGGWHVRGSISAYYHTSMHDLFVAGLCVTGFLLATYRSGEPKKPEFWASLIAGVAVLGVAFFPTGRPGLLPGDPRCGGAEEPPGCAPIQQQWGEVFVAGVHFGCALAFILTLAVICFVFARHDGNKAARLQIVCGVVIILAVVGIIVGELIDATFGELTPLYVGEVVAVWAFAVSWLAESVRAWREVRRQNVLGEAYAAGATG